MNIFYLYLNVYKHIRKNIDIEYWLDENQILFYKTKN